MNNNYTLLRRASYCAIGLTMAFGSYADHVEHIEVSGKKISNLVAIQLDEKPSLSADLSNLVRQLPGANINSNGPVTSIVQYRGLYGDRVPVSLDGSVVSGAGPNSMDPPISHVFALSGASIKLHRGIAPVSVGAETLGGAISVKYFNPSDFQSAQWQGNVMTQYANQGDSTQALANIGYHTDSFYLRGFGTSQLQDDAKDGNGSIIPNSFYDRTAYTLMSGWRSGTHEFNGYVQVVDTDESGTAPYPMDIIYVDSKAYRLRYKWQQSATDNLTVNAFGNSNQHGMDNFQLRPSTDPKSRLNTVDSLARGINVLWLSASDSGQYSLGANWQTEAHNSVITNPVLNNFNIHNFNDIVRTQRSMFAQWEGEYKSVNLVAGARYTSVAMSANEVAHSMAAKNAKLAGLVEQFNNADRNQDPDFIDLSLHVSGDLEQNWSWQAAIARKNRAPTYTEHYVWFPKGISAGLTDGRNYIGNLNLKHETADQIELGLAYVTPKIEFSPRVFYKSIDDYIVGDPSTNELANMVSNAMSGRAPLQWQNIDATFYGLDVLAHIVLANNWYFDINASLVHGERGDINAPLYRIAPATLISRVGWNGDNYRVDLESVLVANQSRVSALQDEKESAGYGVVNATATYAITPKIDVSIIAENLLDKAYQPHLSSTNRVSGEAQPVGEKLFALGRNLALTLNLKF